MNDARGGVYAGSGEACVRGGWSEGGARGADGAALRPGARDGVSAGSGEPRVRGS